MSVRLACAFAGVLLGSGCVHRDTYVVTAQASEAIQHKLDASWFTREIRQGSDRLKAIELVYCPILPAGATVCRSAVVWEAGRSELFPATGNPTPPVPASSH